MQTQCMCYMHIKLPFKEEMMEKKLFSAPGAPESLKWVTRDEKLEMHTPIFDVMKVERESQSGEKKGSFVKLHTTDWIVVIPWFRDEEGVPRFIMEQQYRHGNDMVTREFPGGLVDEGEESLEAAKRELLEETGLKGRITFLGNICPNAAFMDNRQNFYLAEDLELVSSQDLDENEEIDVFSIPVEDAIENMGRGVYDNGTMMMALGYFLRYAEKHPELRERITT